MLEPAHCAGDAPHAAHEQGMSVAPQPHPTGHDPALRPPTPPDTGPAPGTRLPAPGPEAMARAEHERWLRRRSVERQLHDGPALRISALALQLGLLRHRASEPGDDLCKAIDGLQDELHSVLQELREVARWIYPPLLDVAGLGPALCDVAARIESPVSVEAPDHRFGPAAEGAAYFSVTACLDALGPDALPVTVVVRSEQSVLVVEVTGVMSRNVPAIAENMLVQVSHLGGTIDIGGGPVAGTITARIPCE
jgi:signal transduction histidine kinase